MAAEFSNATAMGPMYRYYAGLLADLCSRAGAYGEALEILDRALQSVTGPGVGLFVSELHRVKGVCLAHREPNDQQAQTCLRTALEVARQQGATLLERRAADDLARMALAAN